MFILTVVRQPYLTSVRLQAQIKKISKSPTNAFVSSFGLRFLNLIFHAETAAFDYHGFGMVREPVQHGAGKGAVVVEDFVKGANT
jgi:hypothetical protein